MSTRVQYVGESSDPKHLKKVKRFRPVLEYIAAVWDVRFVIDAPFQSTVIKPHDSQDRTIFLHFFTVPHKLYVPFYSRFIFGFEVPQPELVYDEGGGIVEVVRHDVGITHSANTVNVIRGNPDENPAAEYEGSNLYILFDIAYQKWSGDTLVLFHILTSALPKMLGSEKEAQALAREVLLKERFHKKFATQYTYEEFLTMARAPISSKIANEVEVCSEADGDVENRAKDLIEDRFSVMELEESLRQVARLADKRLARQEFEKLLSWPAIKGIRLEGNSLAVYTKPLTMENARGETFLIGEYKIAITPESHPTDLSQWVQIGEYGWRGPFKHNAIQGAALTPCWGNVIKPELINAFQQYDFMYAIQDALAFLTAESSGGMPNSQYEGLGSPKSLEDSQPFYSNEKDRGEECRKYADFAKHFWKRTIEERFRKELDDKRILLRDKSIEFFDAQTKRISYRNFLQFFERCAQNLPLEEEFSFLLGLSDLFAFEVSQGKISALFSSHFSEKDSAIKPGFSMMLFETGDVKIQKFGSGVMTERALSSEQRDLLFRLTSFGMFGTALKALHDHMIETSEPFESAKKRIDDFLSQNNSPSEEKK